MSEILSFDPGYGNVKVCLNGKVNVLQSVVARPQKLGMAAIGLRTMIQAIGVSFDDQNFITGPGAWNWNEPLNSLDYSALTSSGRRALFYAALTDLLTDDEEQIDLLIIGLPVPLLQDQVQAEAVIEGLKQYKGQHHFLVGEKKYRLNFQRIKVLPQPIGAYADWLLSDELQIRKGGAKAEVAILDLGENTLDLYVIQGGKVSPRFVGGGKVGVRRLFKMLDGTGRDITELDHDLRSGKLKPTDSQLESWLGEVLGTVERIWPDLSRFTAVVPAGGGCMLLGDWLQAALARKGAALQWPKDPVAANAIGLWKWGRYGLNR